MLEKSMEAWRSGEEIGTTASRMWAMRMGTCAAAGTKGWEGKLGKAAAMLAGDACLAPGRAVEGEAEARPVGDGEPAVLRLRRIGEEGFADRHHAEMPLDDPAVHHAGQQVHVEQRPAAAVGDRQVIDLRQVGDLARFGEAAAVGDVGLQDGDCLVLDELAPAPATAPPARKSGVE